MTTKILGVNNNGSVHLECTCGYRFNRKFSEIHTHTRCFYCTSKKELDITPVMLLELFELFNKVLMEYNDGK